MEDDGGLNTDDLAINLFDFLLAGTETSSTTLKWVVLYLTLRQEVQDRCRAEIREVLGDDKCSMEDIQRLPYTQVSDNLSSILQPRRQCRRSTDWPQFSLSPSDIKQKPPSWSEATPSRPAAPSSLTYISS